MAVLSLRSAFDPFQDLLDLQKELDRFLGKPFHGYDFGLSGGGVFPPINVFADKDGIVIRAEVPGVDPKALEISIEGRTLTVSGERKRDETAGSFHRRERSFGKFSRSVTLPEDVDCDRAAAECKNGLLTIRIPRSEAAKPRLLKVESA